MDVFTLKERFRIFMNRRSMGTNCGVLDQGIYYLIVIVLKDILEGDVINIIKKKRDFLKEMFLATNNNTIYRYLLQKIIENGCYIKKWKKWVKFFVHEYQQNVDIILGTEFKHADDVILYQTELLECIRCVDEEEEYINKDQLSNTLNITEMMPAVQRFVSQSQEFPEDLHSSGSIEISRSDILEEGTSDE